MKYLLLVYSLSFSLIVHESIIAQATVESNQSNTPTDFLGWDATTTFDLSIEHKGDDNILFRTKGFTRMFIDNGSDGVTAGRLGLGNNLPVGFAPLQRIHSHTTEGILGQAPNFIRFSSGWTSLL